MPPRVPACKPPQSCRHPNQLILFRSQVKRVSCHPFSLRLPFSPPTSPPLSPPSLDDTASLKLQRVRTTLDHVYQCRSFTYIFTPEYAAPREGRVYSKWQGSTWTISQILQVSPDPRVVQCGRFLLELATTSAALWGGRWDKKSSLKDKGESLSRLLTPKSTNPPPLSPSGAPYRTAFVSKKGLQQSSIFNLQNLYTKERMHTTSERALICASQRAKQRPPPRGIILDRSIDRNR